MMTFFNEGFVTGPLPSVKEEVLMKIVYHLVNFTERLWW